MADPKSLKTITNALDKVQKTLTDLAKTRVMVGVPSDKVDRTGGNPINNATLAYLFENGSPSTNMPARPHIGPGVLASKERWSAYFRQAGKAAFDGRPDIMDKAFHAAGMTAVAAIKDIVAAGIPPPLAPRTVAARRRRHPSRAAMTAADMTPLIDTGQYINSITYVIRKGK